jgi:hypothetical protein
MKHANRKTDYPALEKYDWADLFAQFRDNPNEPHIARVRRILELLKAIKPEARRPDMRVFTELNARMKKYQWRSRVLPSAQGVMEFLRPYTDADGVGLWEYVAVRSLLELFRIHRELDRVHLCEMYGKRAECVGWFYGTPKSLCCSNNCKQYKYDSTDEVKARRARNAKHNRDYRENLKRLEQREKQRVGYKGSYSHRARNAK